jgi:chorismate mutase/prephenate dehydratase
VTPEELRQMRGQIDALDDELVALLARRAALVQEVGRRKHLVKAPVFRPEREVAIIERMIAANTGPLAPASIAAIWLEIISGCRALERVMRVSYLGPAGTYSEQAVRTLFGHRVEMVPCPTLDEAIREAEAGAVDCALLPVENSTEGTVGRTLDILLRTPLRISAEISLPIHHSLLHKDGDRTAIRAIAAHPQALAQCQHWLDENFPGVERMPVSSNGQAAEMASRDAAIAAIAGQLAAQRYGLQSVAERIEDDPNNRTRFAAIGDFTPEACGVDQTSLILSVPDRAGAVVSLIEPLARHGVSMKRFESRPARQGGWEYFFYIDLVGHRNDSNVALALAEIRERAAFFKDLGSYPLFNRLTGSTAGKSAAQEPSS